MKSKTQAPIFLFFFFKKACWMQIREENLWNSETNYRKIKKETWVGEELTDSTLKHHCSCRTNESRDSRGQKEIRYPRCSSSIMHFWSRSTGDLENQQQKRKSTKVARKIEMGLLKVIEKCI